MLANFSKPAACIILLLAFFYLFGYDNILRFLRGGVTVVKYDKKVEGMPPPGIICHKIDKPCPQSPNQGTGAVTKMQWASDPL